jgi:hypothetical protein
LQSKSGKFEESPRALSLRAKQGKSKVKDRTLWKTKLEGVRHPIQKPAPPGGFKG